MAHLFQKPRGQIVCSRCQRNRQSKGEGKCPYCGYVDCAIRLKFKGKTHRIFYDRSGKPYTFQQAEVELIQINAELLSGEFKPDKWISVERAKQIFSVKWDAYISDKEAEAERGEFTFATLKAYKSYRKNHFGFFENMNVREITPDDVKEWYRNLDSKLSQKMRKNIVNALRTFMRTLKLDIEIPKIKVTEQKKSRAIPYEKQIFIINKYIPDKHRDIFLFMRETALRPSEVCAVQVRDLTLNGTLFVQRTYSARKLRESTKGGHSDEIPLSPVALELAKKHLNGKFPKDFLFRNPNTGEGYKLSFLEDIWRNYVTPYIDYTLYESMRHSTITNWALRAKNAFQLRLLARHKDIRDSQRYVHIAKEDLLDIIDVAEVIKIEDRRRKGADNSEDNQ